MTGGSRVAEGPTTKITCRTDRDFIEKQKSASLKNSDFDVSKVSAHVDTFYSDVFLLKRVLETQGEICVGQTGANVGAAYPLIMSISPFSDEDGIQISTGHVLETDHGIDKVDVSYSSFIRDVYDARTPLELELARSQISIFGYEAGSSGSGNEFSATDFMINGIVKSANKKSTRKNAIVFYASSKPTTPYNLASNIKPNYPMVVYRKFDPDTFSEDLQSAIVEITTHRKTSQVCSMRCPDGEEMRVSDWRFHGIALGMGKLDQRDGDNTLTLLRSGAQTIRNGPFKIIGGDPVGWVFPHELVCFDNEGNRRKRWTSSVLTLMKYFNATDTDRKSMLHRADKYYNNSSGVYKPPTTPAVVTDHTGDGIKNTVQKCQVVPLRVAANFINPTDSIRDRSERRMGTAISNAGANSMIDLLIGSDL